MKHYLSLLLTAFILALASLSLPAQGLKIAKLKNGLTVYVWEDSTMTRVFGMLAVNAGSIDDPEEYTGLAHYLEHVMFKGTDRISSLDWEKEAPLYEQIVTLYDRMADERDPAKKKEINGEINRLAVEASRYGKSNEFSSLVESFGGAELNAATSFDYTVYHNSFPASELEKWLEIYSARLINPVFRAFQSELETVYEEYNRAANNPSRQESRFIMDNIFAGTPYARDIIGKAEHLKNPRLGKVTEFYNRWYVPDNMALILVGNIRAAEALPLVNRKFSRLAAQPAPARAPFADTEFSGKRKITGKVGQLPVTVVAFRGVPGNHPDRPALDLCMGLLDNATGSGALNRLATDGDLLGASAESATFKNLGRILLTGVPSYDAAQRRFLSSSSVEKMLLGAVEKLKKGEIDEAAVAAVKTEMCKNHELRMESETFRASRIADAFVSGDDIARLLDYTELVQALTADDVRRVARDYLTDDYLLLNIEQGKAKKEEKFKKPDLQPITSPDTRSRYAEWFERIPSKPVAATYPSLDPKPRKVNDLSKLYHTKNTENGIFSLTLRYGVGTGDMPKLRLAVPLMNNAGIMAQLKPHEFKQALGAYNATASYSVDDDYLYIRLTGIDAHLREACILLTRQILMPALDEKQMNNLVGGTAQSRFLEKRNAETVSDALAEYALYRDKSDYIDRLSLSEINDISISNLTGEFQKATNYAAEIFYVGTLSFDEAYDILSVNLPLKAGEIPSTSPKDKPRAAVATNTVYFVPNPDAEQTHIHFFIESEPYSATDNEVELLAFNQYFSGGFGSVAVNEIREKRSLAYSTYGYLRRPRNPGKPSHFAGFVGTQADKTVEAVELYLKILSEFPEYYGRADIVKTFLTESYNTARPSFRSEASAIAEYIRQGYREHPALSNLPKIEALSFDALKDIHRKYIAGKPVTIAITGNPKDIDVSALAKFGKVEKLTIEKIFK